MNRYIGAVFCLFASLAVAVPAAAQGRFGDYDGNRGYRERPYDRNRHYKSYRFRERHYDYRGHWRSWGDWDSYARRHPELYRNGRYYRYRGHLLFRFCDPAATSCFYFSIGG